MRVDINSLGLGGGDGGQSLDLAVVEIRRTAEITETDGCWGNSMEFRECANSIMPPVGSYLLASGYVKSCQPPSFLFFSSESSSHISLLSCAVTSGSSGSVIILPSRNSMM